MTTPTTSDILLENATKYANMPALSSKDKSGNWNTTTWAEFSGETMAVAKSLTALGFQKGDKLSIYSYNRKEWYIAYAAANFCNGAGVGVYHTCSPEEVEWVVGNSDSKFVFVGHNPMDGGDNEKMCSHRLHKIMDKLDKVEKVIVMDGVDMPSHEKVVSWSDFISEGKDVEDSKIHNSIKSIKPEDTATLIYTSGTTGNPKGVELTYDNFEYEISKVLEIQSYNQGDGYVSWLPCAHVFGQLVDNHAWIREALHMRVVDNPLHAIDYCKEVQPHLFIGVPRIYEKVYSNLVAGLGGKVKLLGIPLLGGIIKKKAKAKIGMSNCIYAITGAAPINPDILELFHKLDIPLFEGYGMTETSAGATIGHKGANKFGSVGKPFAGEIRIHNPNEKGEGEIQFRGRHVMKGYYNNPEATAETMDGDWLKSGDLGRKDSDGFVYVTGRLKEIYVSSAGKNIAPLVIEETMKSMPLISQCMLVGDNRNYCTALFTLDVGAILRDKHGLDGATEVPKDPNEQIAKLESLGSKLSDYTESPEIHAEIDAQVQELNKKFMNPEQVKKFTILPRDLNVDEGELTPTLKIRRKQINDNWAKEINAMYN
ncbi:MAG: AMP-dependent synthetase/ligase [Candidatus Thermoplasmatota archaeon]|nr:AMP-dependent synthetase/ligase [Candidatus Thermoplasmatota archaeon]